MTPYYADDWLSVYAGDCRAVLATLPAESVHCVVTSPPYWGLRDYGDAGQLGLEPTPEQYVANLVAVFREVRRVLRNDGTLWLNLGDSYASGEIGRHDGIERGKGGAGYGATRVGVERQQMRPRTGLKPKDLVGIPWRVAFALQADGWYLRSDIIWSKPNPMPESVTDRPTKSHEYLFLLAKSERYYFDAGAVRERGVSVGFESLDARDRNTDQRRNGGPTGKESHATGTRTASNLSAAYAGVDWSSEGRNIRSVWTVATAPYPGAHFATFPPKLIEPCIKAGTSERGVCAECGAPWRRVVERESAPVEVFTKRSAPTDELVYSGSRVDGVMYGAGQKLQNWRDEHPPVTTGWQPSCAHAAEPVPATVLDCFGGSGTTGMVAQRLSRRALLIDLNPAYLLQCLERNGNTVLGLVG